MHILKPGRGHVITMTSVADIACSRAIALHKLTTYSWLYFISFAMSDYESDVSEFGNIHGILPYQFKPIRLDLSEL